MARQDSNAGAPPSSVGLSLRHTFIGLHRNACTDPCTWSTGFYCVPSNKTAWPTHCRWTAWYQTSKEYPHTDGRMCFSNLSRISKIRFFWHDAVYSIYWRFGATCWLNHLLPFHKQVPFMNFVSPAGCHASSRTSRRWIPLRWIQQPRQGSENLKSYIFQSR